MDTIVKNGKKHHRNLTEEERLEIQAKNKPKRAENGQLMKGQTANPSGRPKKEHTILEIFKSHEGAEAIINKLFKIANTIDTDEPHKDAMSSMKLIVERFIPSLKASELRVDTDNEGGLVYLPSQEEVDKQD